MKILRQHLFLDTIGIELGAALLGFDPELLSDEGRAEVESLINEWGFPAKYRKTHIESKSMPYGVRIEPEKASISMLMETTEPWEEDRAFLIPGFLYDPEDNLYKIWYSVRPLSKNAKLLARNDDAQIKSESNWDYRLCYAYSSDGLKWIKPELPFFKYEDRNTNMLDCSIETGAIFLDRLHRETGKFKAITVRMNSKRTDLPIHNRMFTHIYTSDDGIQWTEMEIEPLQYFFDTQNVIQFDEGLDKYVAYMRAHYNGRAISRCEFDDPAHMPMPTVIMHPDNEDPFDTDYYNNCFTFYPGDPSIRLLFPSVFSHRTDMTSVRMAVSRNGRNFQWVSREEVIANVLPDGEILGTIYACPGMISTGNRVGVPLITGNLRHDELRIYRTYENCHEKCQPSLRFASWEIDRLAGIVAEETGEIFVLANINGQNPRLQLNLRSKGHGRVRAEICSTNYSAPFEGYTLQDSDGLIGDIRWNDYNWKDKKDLSEFIGQTIEIRLHIENAKLFGYRIVADEGGKEANNNEDRIISAL